MTAKHDNSNQSKELPRWQIALIILTPTICLVLCCFALPNYLRKVSESRLPQATANLISDFSKQTDGTLLFKEEGGGCGATDCCGQFVRMWYGSNLSYSLIEERYKEVFRNSDWSSEAECKCTMCQAPFPDHTTFHMGSCSRNMFAAGMDTLTISESNVEEISSVLDEQGATPYVPEYSTVYKTLYLIWYDAFSSACN